MVGSGGDPRGAAGEGHHPGQVVAEGAAADHPQDIRVLGPTTPEQPVEEHVSWRCFCEERSVADSGFPLFRGASKRRLVALLAISFHTGYSTSYRFFSPFC